MKLYSSTTLKYFTKHCPKALKLYLQGEYYPREVFQAGIAAHAVLEEIGRKQPPGIEEMRIIAYAVVDQLIRVGHSYYGAQEPPMQPEAALEGRDIALSYAESNPVPEGKYELPLAMDAEGFPCIPGQDEARYRALIDCIYEDIEGDEDFSGNVIVIRDYKSAWPTGEAELETLQRKGQAVLAWLNLINEGVQGIKMEVVNLRSHKSFSRTIWLDQEGEATLEQWKNDILQVCRAADATEEARPGVGCLDCPWVMDCVEAQSCAGRAEMPVDLACLEGTRKELIKRLKVTLAESPAEVPGGFIGFKNKPKKSPVDDAPEKVVSVFYHQADGAEPGEDVLKNHGDEVSLISALKIGSGQINSISKVLFPGKSGKQDREVFAAECLEDVGSVEFGIHKK